jgi:ankyrin repeat protein
VKELGADVNLATTFGETALIIAAKFGQVDAVRCLGIDLDADINQVTHQGRTALYLAAQHLHMDVLRCLGKELGADVNLAEEIHGCTALSVAAITSH